MKKPLFAALALTCAAANAQVYKCPAEVKGTYLTSAKMLLGARDDAHALHGDVEQIAGGTNVRYNFAGESPRWLVCQYGGRRIEGTAISAPEVIGGRESWVPLDPMIDTCDLAIRKIKSKKTSESTWTAAATCNRKQPPPPDMV
jgi:hypothetical protein